MSKYTRCSICSSKNTKKYIDSCRDYISREHFQVNYCIDCQIHFTAPYQMDIGKYYGINYYNSNKGKFFGVFNTLFDAIQKSRANYILRRFSPKKILDIGCGQANMIAKLAEHGVHTLGVESHSSTKWLFEKQGLEIISDNEFIEKMQSHALPKQDLIVMWHVIEHIKELSKNLTRLRNIIDDVGFLFISCPNVNSLQSRIFKDRWFHLDTPRHLYHFNKKSLSRILHQHDFEVLEVSAGDISQNVFGWFQSIANTLSRGCHNSLYQLLQGTLPRSRKDKINLSIQCITAPLWLLVGTLGYILESASGNHGSITLVAKPRETAND